MQTSSQTISHAKIEINLSGKDILERLNIPATATNVTIKFHVPGGGDYSNMDLDINDDEHVITVKYDVNNIPINIES